MSNRDKRGQPKNPPARMTPVVDQPVSTTLISHRQEHLHTGPIPAPETLKGYLGISSTFPERIVAMAEREQAHRQANEVKIVDAQIAELAGRRDMAGRGQWFGFVLGGAFGVGGTICIMTGHDWAGATIGTVTLGVIVTTFVLGRTIPDNDGKGPAKPPEEPASVPATTA